MYWITHGVEYSESLPILYDCLAPEFVVLPSNERLEIRRIISEQISVVRQAASREDIQEAQSYSRHQYANSDQGNDAEFEFNQDALNPFVLSAIRTIYDTIKCHLQDDLHGLFDMGVLAEQGVCPDFEAADLCQSVSESSNSPARTLKFRNLLPGAVLPKDFWCDNFILACQESDINLSQNVHAAFTDVFRHLQPVFFISGAETDRRLIESRLRAFSRVIEEVEQAISRRSSDSCEDRICSSAGVDSESVPTEVQSCPLPSTLLETVGASRSDNILQPESTHQTGTQEEVEWETFGDWRVSVKTGRVGFGEQIKSFPPQHCMILKIFLKNPERDVGLDEISCAWSNNSKSKRPADESIKVAIRKLHQSLRKANFYPKGALVLKSMGRGKSITWKFQPPPNSADA
ncbi:MAG: hypothetical protein KDA68_12340 [Planctomycetaceae bacterium]|nr:hypothetical protein [Planctomycetaceae bacterium]